MTKDGVIIDGFAGPQKADHSAQLWTARRLLELKPAWISRFYLCDLDPGQVRLLESLKSTHHRPPKRYVAVYAGDFNMRLVDILAANRIRRKTPTFALLDMRTFECSWTSVEKLARHKPDVKIEMLYFLATGWLRRAASRASSETLTRWWGGREWREHLDGNNVDLALAVSRRFEVELGYASAVPYPIFRDDRSRKVLYYLVHATDHPRAPHLMMSAYTETCGDRLAGSGLPAARDLFSGSR